jgi:hypothetical protein
LACTFSESRVSARKSWRGVGPLRALGHEHLVALLRLKAPLGPHAQDVVLDGQIDRVGLDAREVEFDDELVAAAVGVHRESPRHARRGGRELLGEPVKLAKGSKRISMGGAPLPGGSSTQASLGVLLGPLELREPSHRCEPQADILGPVQVVAVAVVARLGR